MKESIMSNDSTEHTSPTAAIDPAPGAPAVDKATAPLIPDSTPATKEPSLEKPLRGRVALVTGSSTHGIGYGIARALANLGADIMLNGLGDPVLIEDTRSHLESDFGIRALYHPANLAKRSEISDLVATTVAKLGGLDILVNNAGVQHVSSIVDFPEDKYRLIIDVNQNSAWYLCKDALPHMSKWGRIINIASTHGLVGSANKSAYVMTKHAIVGLTKTIALEYAKTNVRVNAICPGWVYTDLVVEQIKQRQSEKGFATFEAAEEDLLREKEPTVHFTTVEQLGGIAAFLCSSSADNITGAAIPCDGAWTAE
jgi:3-hydroxybutyrate dehydrogenase